MAAHRFGTFYADRRSIVHKKENAATFIAAFLTISVKVVN